MPGGGRRSTAWLIPPLIGAIFVGVGGWMLSDAIAFDRVARPAMGEVLSVHRTVDRDPDGGRSVTYRPRFRYRAANGETHAGETHISSSAYDFAIGSEVAILYDPANPGDVRVDGGFSLWGLPILFTAMGGLVTLGGLVVWIRRPPGDDADPRRTPTVRRD